MFQKLKFVKDKPYLADFLDLVALCAITFVIAKLLTTFVILNGYVPSGSMENTIMTDDRIIANRLAYINSDPKRGDIVVFYSPDHLAKGEKVHFVKRVIGVPGDEIKIMDNKLYINGKQVEEPYLLQETKDNWPAVRVPEGKYFMLGDNRNNSDDSRKWTIKFVDRKDILGKVFLKYSLKPSRFHFSIVKSYNDYNL